MTLKVDGRIDSRDLLDIIPSDTQFGAERKERLSQYRRQERRIGVGTIRGHDAGVTRLHLAINLRGENLGWECEGERKRVTGVLELVSLGIA